MEDIFMFSAQPEISRIEKPPNPPLSAKRFRPLEADVIGDSIRKPTIESFKSKLLSASSPDNWRGFGTNKEKLKIADGDVRIIEGPNGPEMKLSEDLKLKLCKPWENALILKIMGRPHTLNFMLAKLKQKWPLIGHWQVTDLEDGYFIARFQMLEDLETVLTGGPWVIANQYLAVQRWRPNFVPGESEIQRMMVWVRLSKLPMEWVDVGLLHSIGGMIGTAIKVDPITETQARGRFARICVEIDIMKPLRSSVIVEGRDIKVEYENLGLICFKCGKIGHSRDYCKEGVSEMNEEANVGGGQVGLASVGEVVKEIQKEPYGPWMQVSYGRTNRNQFGSNSAAKRNGFQGNVRRNYSDRQGRDFIATGTGKAGVHEESRKEVETAKVVPKKTAAIRIAGKAGFNKLEGSRFAILNETVDEEGCVENETVNLNNNHILAEISNRKIPDKKQTNPMANKYLFRTDVNKACKENGEKLWIKRPGKVTKMKQQQLSSNQSRGAEVNLTDAEVLQALHKDMGEIRGDENQPSTSEVSSHVDRLKPEEGRQVVV